MLVGCDYDSHSIYLCALDPDDRDSVPQQISVQLRPASGDITQAIAAVPTALSMALGKLNVTKADLWVERGTGASRKGDWILGAICGAILATWPRVTYGSPARLITTAAWKQAVGAPGNCGKPIANHFCTLQWRSRYPDVHPPTDHNHLDAFGIAIAGATK